MIPALAGLAAAAAGDPKLKKLADPQARVAYPSLTVTGGDGSLPVALAAAAQGGPLLVVTASAREASDLSGELASFLGTETVHFFPSCETLPHERLSPAADTVGTRAKVIHQLVAGDKQSHETLVVVTSARGFCQPFLAEPKGSTPLKLLSGRDYPLDEVVRNLVRLCYTRVDMVARRGEFAVRGGIIDVFPVTDVLPVRIDFFGDEITDIDPFTVGDQRTLKDSGLDDVVCFPARMLPVTDDVAARAKKVAVEHQGNATLVEMLTTIAEGEPADGMEAILPALSDEPFVTLLDLLPEKTAVVVVAEEKTAIRISDLVATDAEFLAAGWEAAAMGATDAAPVHVEGLDLEASSFRTLQSLQITANNRRHCWWRFNPPGMALPGADMDDESAALSECGEDDEQTLVLEMDSSPVPRGDLAQIATLMEKLKIHVGRGGRAAFIAPTAAVAARMSERFLDSGVSASRCADGDSPKPGMVSVYTGFLVHGFTCMPRKLPGFEALPLVVYTETDLTGNRVTDLTGAKRRPAKKRQRVDPLALKTGDLVVHESHGIGRFVEMTERTMTKGDATSRREYLVIEYAPSRRGGPCDRLYVPMDSLDLLSRYVGGEKPPLSKMGGGDWANTKRKAKKAVKEIAGELIELYAKRQAAPGRAFGPDSPWQREMEDNFPYVETEDQMLAIDAVKEDMEKPVPMDRVIVGDVGYGKTEVAVRAAFKAVQDGAQVAVLVPTTLLAQQHTATFTERMEGFPVTIACLSRFTSKKDSEKILAGMADGTVDIVIGTHRLLQTGVQWKNLGLIVVDEEQRFGVEHKEHIKALRTHVDVLTMSATPIPRTLEMSMAGIREMSTILTPPEDRRPVLTYVGPQEDAQIAAAIRRELLRDGQVFVVHNKVKTIERRAQTLRDLIPEARIVVAHGQMNEDILEKTVQGFWDREFDVLVCTTIVETGLDIANANTLIVENAHHMGLSQLHQLRGRVGRSRERAYAYFLYPKDQLLTETSYDRLATIAKNNDLGAGMAVAQKDLEMRGAGNVLGAEQSGHIAGVGFDLYMRLVGDAVEAFKSLADGTPVDGTDKEPSEIKIDLAVDAHIPESYINSERLRLAVYRQLAQSKDDEDLAKIDEELIDRYGPVPIEVQRLYALSRLRHSARASHVTDIGIVGTRLRIHPLELPDSKQVRLKRLYPGSNYRAAMKTVTVPVPKAGTTMTAEPLRDIRLIQWVANVITRLSDRDDIDMSAPLKHPGGKN